MTKFDRFLLPPISFLFLPPYRLSMHTCVCVYARVYSGRQAERYFTGVTQVVAGRENSEWSEKREENDFCRSHTASSRLAISRVEIPHWEWLAFAKAIIAARTSTHKYTNRPSRKMGARREESAILATMNEELLLQESEHMFHVPFLSPTNQPAQQVQPK